MNFDKPKESESLNSSMDGPEEKYTDCVQVLSDKDAVRPESTKIKHISVRPILVKIIYGYFMVYLDTG